MTNLRNERYFVKLEDTQQGIDRLTELTLLKINLMNGRDQAETFTQKDQTQRVLQAFHQMFI